MLPKLLNNTRVFAATVFSLLNASGFKLALACVKAPFVTALMLKSSSDKAL
jgi:hypothetical protein